MYVCLKANILLTSSFADIDIITLGFIHITLFISK